MDTMSSASIPVFDLKRLLLEQAVLLWRRKWLAVGVAWGVCLLGWAAVMTLPKTYEANARVYVDVNGLLTPLLRGLIVENNAARDVGFIRQTLLSRPNLEQIAHLSNLDLNKDPDEVARITDALSGQIVLAAQGQNLFRIAYSNQDPEIARRVVESVLTVFSENANSSSRIEMDNAQDFLSRQIAEYEDQLRAAEGRRAEFRRNFSEYLPDSATGVSRLSTLEREVVQMTRSYEDAVTSRLALVSQLNQVPRFISLDAAPTVNAEGQLVGASSSMRLAQARAELAALREKYTDLHPSVIGAQRQVRRLEEQVQNEGITGGEGQGTTQISNPIYEQVRLKLVDADLAVQAASNRLNEAIAERDQARALFAEVPDIEARSIDLDRDYEIRRSNYEELLKRRESAVLSQAAEDQADITQFRVIDPPFAPQYPSSPNFPVMLSLVLMFGMVAGGGIPLGYELLRGSYSSASGLRELGLPVIGSVTYVSPPGKARSLTSGIVGPTLTMTGLLIVYGVLVFLGANASIGFS